MGSEANIVVKLKDAYSQGTMRMQDANKGFNKSLEETQRQAQQYGTRLDALTRKQAELQTGMTKAKHEADEARKAFLKSGEAADSDALTKANEKYLGLKQQMGNTAQAAKDTQKAMRELDTENTKRGAAGDGQSMIARLGAAGATAMIGNMASQAVGTYASSALGEVGGNYVASMISSASAGAAIGTALAPGVGTAIGAALGGVLGIVQGKMDELGKEDDAYKGVVQETYTGLQSQDARRLESGSGLAAQREQDTIAFNRLLGGAGNKYLADLRVMAADTPLEYGDLTGMSRALATGFSKTPDRMLALMTGIGDAGSAVGIDTGGMAEMSKAMSRMQSSNKASLEYLNIFQERGVNVIGMLSEGLGTTQEKIYDMISKSQIKGVDAVNIIQAGMEDLYSGSMEKQSQTFSGLTSTLSDAQGELANAQGEGYNTLRKQGMQEQVDFLGGETGAQMQDAYRMMGEFQASLENQQEQLQRDAFSSVMNGVLEGTWSEETKKQLAGLMADYDHAKLEEDGAEMGRVLSAAQALAQAEYTDTEGYRAQVDANLKLTNDIQTATASSYYTAGYELAQEQTKGYVAGMQNSTGELSLSAKARALQNTDQSGSQILPGRSHAFGLGRVPFDNYPALLHEGETVLTANQTRQRGGGQAIHIAKLAEQMVIREEADIDKFAAAFVEKLSVAMLTDGGIG